MTGCALLNVIVSFLPCNCFCKRKSKVPIRKENNSTILNNEKESTNTFEVNDTSKTTNQHLENNDIPIPPPLPENLCQNDCEDVTKKEPDIALIVTNESGNSLRSSPHGRLRMRNRSLSGGSEDGKQRKTSVPQISVSECLENPVGRLSAASSEKDSSGVQEDEIDQAFAYHCRSQMSLSSFGGRSESVTSVYSAAGGGRYGTVTVTGEVLFGLSYNYKTSTLEINIKECRNLAAVDMKRNRSDPYVKVYLLPDRTKSGKRKTKVKKHTLNPVFEESLKFHVTINELVIRTLWLSVWHSDRFGRNDFLGEVMLPLGSDVIESSGSKWYPLQERLETLDTPVSYKGDLILALKYAPPDVTSRKFSKKPDLPVKGSLEVLVREARNLMATRSNGTSDPFCKSYLLPDKSKSGKQKTPVFKKSCNPKWNHTFVYEDVSLEDLKERCLELTIWDYDKITSNDFLGGVRLCLGTGKCQGREVDWMDSVGEERSLWYTMLERPNTWVDGSLLLRPNMQNRRIA
ncbi:synaptotagmin-like protein 4 [Trichonephila clavipes]|nr:synaptotagmin-like protein 4 [Trichonephila clavipes]